MLDKRREIESHLSVLFPHWNGGHVIVTDVKESRLFKHDELQNSAGTMMVVEFLFEGRVYAEGIDDFTKRAECIT